jgi:hypothetical protein
MIRDEIYRARARTVSDAHRAAHTRRPRFRPNWTRWLILLYCVVSWVLLGLLLGWLFG